MALLDRLFGPPQGARLLRAILTEQRRQSVALDRIAAALEQEVFGQVQHVSPPLVAGQPSSQAGQRDDSGVSYADPGELARLFAIEDELKSVLGRDPSEGELERAIAERL